MILKNKITHLLAIILIILTACNKGPKVIDTAKETSTGVFSNDTVAPTSVKNNSSFTDDLHKIKVNEILPTKKYIYLNVNEGEEQYWIATRSKEVKVGETYYYKGGLLKTNFESKEYNRMFEKIYLVSSLVEANHGNNSNTLNTNNDSHTAQPNPTKENIPTHTEKIVAHKGSIKIAELVKDPKKYEGKTIQISGVCSKINPGIMDRNWIHIKDGSKDDFDLVVTSSVFVPEGTTITIKALVSLNKDFGAGYTYDLILEDGVLVK